MKTDIKTLRERVNKGIAFLDSHIPNWHNLVHNVEDLNITSGACCVLGQVGRSYYSMIGDRRVISPYDTFTWEFRLSINKQIDYGFFSLYEDDEVLTELWRDVILDRREQETWAKQCRRRLTREMEEVLV
jgi:hypothetical protein